MHGYGFGQDEDQGQLGGWFVLASMGIFDVQGHASAEPTFQFGSPLFGKVTIHLPGKKKLIIETKNNSAENHYIQSATFNGRAVDNAWMPRKQLASGGHLVFVMGPEPNTGWGVKTPPPSMTGL
jgi:putative alpha-1,2-mannosidase